jgi:hypothetical protein
VSDSDSLLIEFIDKVAALAKFPREDRIRAARVEIDQCREMLGLGAASYANDDGKPWGRIDPETKVWEEIDKTPVLKTGLGPPPFYYTAPGGRFVHVVHKP